MALALLAASASVSYAQEKGQLVYTAPVAIATTPATAITPANYYQSSGFTPVTTRALELCAFACALGGISLLVLRNFRMYTNEQSYT